MKSADAEAFSKAKAEDQAQAEAENTTAAQLMALQVYLDGAYAALSAMRERAERVLAQAKADAHLTDAYDSALIQHRLAERLTAVAESKSPLTFGRIGDSRLRKTGEA